jgi:hypothetical protein
MDTAQVARAQGQGLGLRGTPPGAGGEAGLEALRPDARAATGSAAGSLGPLRRPETGDETSWPSACERLARLNQGVA